MHLKKNSADKKTQNLEKTHGFSEKNSRYRDLTVIALHREPKKLKKSSKKLKKSPKNSENFQKKLTLPGFDSYKIPQKCTKIEPGVSHDSDSMCLPFAL